jgi:hypothetical protein
VKAGTVYYYKIRTYRIIKVNDTTYSKYYSSYTSVKSATA